MKIRNEVGGIPMLSLIENRILPLWLFRKANGLHASLEHARTEEGDRLDRLRAGKIILAVGLALMVLCLLGLLTIPSMEPLGLVEDSLFGYLSIISLGLTVTLVGLVGVLASEQPTKLATALNKLHLEVLTRCEFVSLYPSYVQRFGPNVSWCPDGVCLLCSMTEKEFKDTCRLYLHLLAKKTVLYQVNRPNMIEDGRKCSEDYRRAFWAIQPFLGLTENDYLNDFKLAGEACAKEQADAKMFATALLPK